MNQRPNVNSQDNLKSSEEDDCAHAAELVTSLSYAVMTAPQSVEGPVKLQMHWDGGVVQNNENTR